MIQKADEVVGEVAAMLAATLSNVAYAAALDEVSLWPSRVRKLPRDHALAEPTVDLRAASRFGRAIEAKRRA